MRASDAGVRVVYDINQHVADTLPGLLQQQGSLAMLGRIAVVVVAAAAVAAA